ncbi:MAG: quinone-dependent dihydroorotate dehydrogenase [Firmicutes bacterium]|nr:quinone-dependent dihydroorotate dehydrogenase [Bacillota bacterium]
MSFLLKAYDHLRPVLFTLQPETAHGVAFAAGRVLQQCPGGVKVLEAMAGQPSPSLARKVGGLSFATPLGLAAGLDKGAELLPVWKALGFGFVEIGTVTPRPQPGNPKPRCFRIPSEGLILNRMGFNSEGAEVVAKRLKRRPKGLVVGGNIGKNKVTPEETALEDYRAAYRWIAPEVDYIALNISSPNTPGLRRLQAPEALKPLLEGLLHTRREMALEAQPIFVKLAPDLAFDELDAIVEVIAASGVEGLIATNTTLDRGIVSEAQRKQVLAWGDGGLSGVGLKAKAQAVRRRILERISSDVCFMACGGLSDGLDAREALDDGADLVQIYSALIFQGPGLVNAINARLV